MSGVKFQCCANPKRPYLPCPGNAKVSLPGVFQRRTFVPVSWPLALLFTVFIKSYENNFFNESMETNTRQLTAANSWPTSGLLPEAAVRTPYLDPCAGCVLLCRGRQFLLKTL